jgi:hypothetical protein
LASDHPFQRGAIGLVEISDVADDRFHSFSLP